MNNQSKLQRLLCVAVCFFCIGIMTAFAQEQKVTVELKNATLKQVFKSIEGQTTYRFSYRNTLVDDKNDITISKRQVGVSVVLNEALKGRNLTYTIVSSKSIVISDLKEQSVPSKNKRVSGTVKSTNGESIIGANVKVTGTTIGCITDIDGNFTLEVPENAKLTVSYIGFQTQEVAINGKSSMSIVLKEDTEMLDEVVVVGYGTQKKVNLTGAVASVSMEKTLGDRPISNVAAALQGAVPGLKIESSSGAPGDALSYNIRGTTSINGGAPLVLVNNVPMDINMIDPQDVESVSILKDAASAAIYGARAAFGVVLITTKQGKKDMTPQFNYNNNFSFSQASELPQKATPLESVLAYKEMGWPNDTYVDGKNITRWEEYIRDYQLNPSKYPNGYVFDEQGNLFLMRENDMFDDMMDSFGFMQNHSFSVSGGSQKTTYRLSLGYTGEDGILITDKDKYNRINMSSFLSIDVNKWLTTQLDIRYANSTQNKVEQGGRNGVWGSAMQLPSYQNISDYTIDEIVYPAETSATYIRYGEPRVIKKTDFRALGRVILSPIKGLKITGEYTYNRITNYNRMYINKYQYVGMNFTGIINNVP